MLVIGSVFSQIFKSVIDDVNWTPSSIFYGGEPGVWFDPSDITTLFQDSAGSTPLTAPGQTVGKMLDKSGRGNHATQATSTQRPTYGINPIVGTRNLLIYTEQIDNAAWAKFNSTVTANSSTAPDGTTTADKLIPDTTSNQHRIDQVTTISAATYTFSVYAKADGYNQVYLRIGFSPAAYFSLVDGSITLLSGGTATALNVGNGWWRFSLTGASLANSTIRINAAVSDSITFAGNGTSGVLIWGSQLELGSAATAYQKVVSQYEVTQSGVASAPYLAFDGVDDGMVTGTITPATNKVQVFTGLRKLSDAAQQIVAEMSATIASNAGAFALTAPNSAAANYNFSSKGTTQTDNVVTTYAAPITNVISGLGNIAEASNLIRVNGAQVGSTLTTQGTGNYLAYPLYIGRRGGTTLPFNGRLYSMIVRFGNNLAANQIVSAENWVNGKTGAY